jgi:glycerol-3-phosphate dehydrogenase (NAD(P)+)
MGTALATHLARKGEQVALWGSEHDTKVLPELREMRSHPALPGRLPDQLEVFGPDELDLACKGASIGVLAAHSGGARSLAGLVRSAIGDIRFVVSIAKGLEPETHKRPSQVYGEELDRPVVVIGGPALAAEVAEGLPCAAVLACEDRGALRRTAEVLHQPGAYVVHETDDCIGLELCSTAKNVGAIGAGILEGIGMRREQGYKNARAALFTRAVAEMCDFIEALGGRRDTAMGLAGLGDLLVTSIGGRNRQYGEMIGGGADPRHAETDLQARGMTVEGVDSARDVHELAKDHGVAMPVHEAIYRVVHENAAPASVVEAVL